MEYRSIFFIQFIFITVLYSDGKSLEKLVLSYSNTTPAMKISHLTDAIPTSPEEWDETTITNFPIYPEIETQPEGTIFSLRESSIKTERIFDEQDSLQTTTEAIPSTTLSSMSYASTVQSDSKFQSAMIKLENIEATHKVPITSNPYIFSNESSKMTTQVSIEPDSTMSENDFAGIYSIQEPKRGRTENLSSVLFFQKNLNSMTVVDAERKTQSVSNNKVRHTLSPPIKTSTTGPVTLSTLSIGNTTTSWPVKHASVVEGDVVLGGLMMVHSREDSITCGPIMPQGGIQALEAMLYTLDQINENELLPDITLGAHILDDCDKDTYGLEMAVDFIKVSECLSYPDFSVVAVYKKLVVGCAFLVPDVGFNEAYISFMAVHPMPIDSK